jgi:hypothetical protein
MIRNTTSASAFGPGSTRRAARPVLRGAMVALLALCLAPIVSIIAIEALLTRDCRTASAREGDAGGNLVWRIEVQRCGGGPLVTNVLLAPRGKSFALVASSTGQPAPVAVERSADGVTRLLLAASPNGAAAAIVLALKPTGRPVRPVVLADGQVKP